MDQTKISELAKERHPAPSERSLIPGWGIDAAPERRVGSPKDGHFTPAENGAKWETPEQQETDVTIFVSTERPGITPVFGTMQPPRGLSGAIRASAYRYGEGKRRRWLMLMAADRVDVVESAVTDLFLHPAGAEGKPRKIRRNSVLVVAAGLGVLGYFLAANYRNRLSETD